MLTIFFAANATELDALIASGNLNPVAKGLPSVDTGGVSPMALVTLDAAVTGADAESIADDVLHEPLANIDDGEQLLFRARRELTSALVGGGNLESAAGIWADTDEMAADGYSDDTCLAVMRALTGLAEQAESSGRDLYTWLCV